jgi:putative DNA primase/helicase
MFKAALEYAKMGWFVFPLKERDKVPLTSNGFKDATTDPEVIKAWWQRWPNANIGIDCGRSSLIVIDLDKKPNFNGKDPWDKLCKKYAIDTNTPTAFTGGGGLHLFFKAPDAIMLKNSAGKLGKGIDVRGNGGYIVAPPSIHPNCTEYKWDYTLNPKLPIKELPEAFIGLLRAPSSPKTINSKGHISEGQRNIELASRAGAMRRKGMAPEAIEAALIIENNKHCTIPLSDAEVRNIARSIGQYPPDSGMPDYPLTDLGNAERFAFNHKNDIRYCHPTEKWHVWNGKIWIPDDRAEIRRLAQQLVKEIMHKEIDRSGPNISKAFGLQSHSRINGMIEEVKPLISVLPSDFDQYPMLVNCENGVIDLATGQRLPHDPHHMLTKIMPVVYDPNAKAKRWLEFLNEIMRGDEELIAFLQRLVGYSLTGNMSEQCFIILYGSGENGKSTFLNTIMTMMGSYALTTPPEGIMIKKYGTGIPIEMARLPGIRLTSVPETEAGQRLAESLIKQFTGGEEITARALYGQLFSFRPIAKIWIQTNHKPDIRGRDHAIWRRVVLIPFNFRVDPAKKDPCLCDKLKKELPAILNWGIDGFHRWHEYGLMIPENVRAAVEDYRQDSDILGNFLSETCEEDSEGYVKGSDIRQYYMDWCKANSEDVQSPQWLGKMLSERFKKAKDGAGNIRYHGIRLKSMEKSLFGKTEDVKSD